MQTFGPLSIPTNYLRPGSILAHASGHKLLPALFISVNNYCPYTKILGVKRVDFVGDMRNLTTVGYWRIDNILRIQHIGNSDDNVLYFNLFDQTTWQNSLETQISRNTLCTSVS